jgi:glucose/arabinose dehydrogenase
MKLVRLLTALAFLAVACGNGDGEPGEVSPPSFVGPAPGATAGPGTGSLPAPVGVSSLDGIRLQLRRVAEVREPVSLTTRPNTTTLYIAEKTGRVKRMAVDRQVTDAGEVMRASFRVDPDPVLDITSAIDADGERGLLGLAFSADGGELYVYSTDRQGTLTLDAYRMDGEDADTGTRRSLLRIPHPRSNHNGGQLARGPDGFLYVGIGDGGGGGDPDENGQNPATLLGKILRIDPSRPADGKEYGIPAGNPFSGRSTPKGAPEVWAYGLRNPWRFSFDRDTGDLWVGDVGQNAWEEVDLLPAAPGGAGRGANLGWNRMEGTHPYDGGTPPDPYVPPLFDYDRAGGACSVIGGYVYRGATHPEWEGMYVWTDYCRGRVHLVLRRPDGRVEDRDTGVTAPRGDLESNGSITSFGEDSDGELYALSAAGGIYRLEPA